MKPLKIPKNRLLRDESIFMALAIVFYICFAHLNLPHNYHIFRSRTPLFRIFRSSDYQRQIIKDRVVPKYNIVYSFKLLYCSLFVKNKRTFTRLLEWK